MAKTKKEKKIKGVTLHKSGRWMWRFQHNGKCFCGYEDTQKAAADALEKNRYEVKTGKYYQADKVTVDSFYEEWFQTFIEPHKKPKTAEIYKMVYLIHIAPDFGKMPVQSITNLMLQKWLNKQAEKYAAKTVRLHITVIDQILQQAVNSQIIQINPANKLQIPTLKETEKKEALTAEQEALFFKYAKENRFYVLFRLAALTGGRVGELLALTWNDIDLENGFISITKTLMRTTGKGYFFNSPKSKTSIRSVPLPPEGVQMLKEYKNIENLERISYGTRKERDDMRRLLFHTSSLSPLSASEANEQIKKIADRMRKDGIDMPQNFSMHTFRHCYATRCIENGMDYKTASTNLGHSGITITSDIYVSCNKEKQRQEVLKVAPYL